MIAQGRADLAYGILVRSIPSQCDRLVACALDIEGNVVTSELIAVPSQTALDEFVDFEDGELPPAGWDKVTSASGSGTSVSIDPSAAHSGTRGLRCVDNSTTEASTQRAGIEFALPPGRFEWRVEGWFNPVDVQLALGQAVFLLFLLDDNRLSVAARIHNNGGKLRPRLVARNVDDELTARDASAEITTGVWRKWRLEILRVGTRKTTAILYLDEAGRMKEQIRLDWDSTTHEPSKLRAGLGFSSLGAAATVWSDELRVTECELSL